MNYEFKEIYNYFADSYGYSTDIKLFLLKALMVALKDVGTESFTGMIRMGSKKIGSLIKRGVRGFMGKYRIAVLRGDGMGR